MPGGGAGNRHRRVGGNPPVQLAIDDNLPCVAILLDFENGNAMCRLRLADVVGASILAVGREKPFRVVVFIVDGHHETAIGQRKKAHAVIIVAKGQFLRFAGATSCLVERLSLAEQRVAPADQRVPAVPFRHDNGVSAACGNGAETDQPIGCGSGRWCQRRCPHNEGSDAEGRGPGQKAAPRNHPVRDPVEVGFGCLSIGKRIVSNECVHGGSLPSQKSIGKSRLARCMFRAANITVMLQFHRR